MDCLAVFENRIKVFSLHVVRASVWLVRALEHAKGDDYSLCTPRFSSCGDVPASRKMHLVLMGFVANDSDTVVEMLLARTGCCVLTRFGKLHKQYHSRHGFSQTRNQARIKFARCRALT